MLPVWIMEIFLCVLRSWFLRRGMFCSAMDSCSRRVERSQVAEIDPARGRGDRAWAPTTERPRAQAMTATLQIDGAGISFLTTAVSCEEMLCCDSTGRGSCASLVDFPAWKRYQIFIALRKCRYFCGVKRSADNAPRASNRRSGLRAVESTQQMD
jgi:hypothetical protein